MNNILLQNGSWVPPAWSYAFLFVLLANTFTPLEGF